ncbi:hypothetical protein [uncultured Ilyobacter sp.]|nr:hypothetical protein [uncultured Ilyobacter sp.]
MDIKGKTASKKWDKNAFIYDKSKGEYICPNGERLTYQGSEEKETENGYI